MERIGGALESKCNEAVPKTIALQCIHASLLFLDKKRAYLFYLQCYTGTFGTEALPQAAEEELAFYLKDNVSLEVLEMVSTKRKQLFETA